MFITIIAILPLLPFFGWGIIGLVRRYRYHEDSGVVNEIFTLSGLVLFYALEMNVLRSMLDEIAWYIFSILGLFVAGAALYGHVLVAFLSRMIIDVVSYDGTEDRDRPRFGPVEALERQGDYEGALQEYLVMARVYPHEAGVYARMAQCQLQLEDPEGAVQALRHGLRRVKVADRAFILTNRMVEILDRHLELPDEALQSLEQFVEHFPNAEEVAMAQARMETVGQHETHEVSTALEALDSAELEVLDAAVEEEEEYYVELPESEPQESMLEALEEQPLLIEEEDAAEEELVPQESEEPILGGLTAMDDSPLASKEETVVPPKKPAAGLGLVALDEAPVEDTQPTDDKETGKPTKSKNRLEPLGGDLEAL